jgi:hypothetical protein
MIVEGGGLLDIGDRHFAVPWADVEFGSDRSVHTSVKARGAAEDERYEGEAVAKPVLGDRRAFRMTELLDDYVRSDEGTIVGYVDDIILSRDGRIEAVVLQPNSGYGTHGRYALPFYGYRYGWHPGYDYYAVPVPANELAELGPFDYRRMKVSPVRRGDAKDDSSSAGDTRNDTESRTTGASSAETSG